MVHEYDKTLKVCLVRSLIGVRSRHRLSVHALGLSKVSDMRKVNDTPQVRGLIKKVHYLVRIQD
ncbi:50S ribosomal protein L30 [Xylella fastidiosa]|uniref:Large ribosomal subunit protein uL30 n=1 Tax=Xylella fastidiosa subsp. multiplex TaxID=644357 RepID=A0A9Q4QT43_XYLFS|nr:50S ribosomal protein L30 [Xylella fastidiosa]KAJ4852329.1 50S ribosomal protein L30 [Xylella fastidiosa subsp. multiplex]MBE0268371.1 50S ribosomal protein L30 [Xylella fastidiosa subsp. multiplex]MBE0275045.1 50S ribosomal protein L30 [Xylella fastidiosa subsp. multiplex]MBE0277329.1 50S ribosomal protein L30 [Xylella fastidiosa subsp. multiplex]MBE0281613.1 50S ribosomal protein L30 [Xylella fastidiosa subsp. multiplex]